MFIVSHFSKTVLPLFSLTITRNGQFFAIKNFPKKLIKYCK